MNFDRNIVVFAGPSATGKTEGMNRFREFLRARGIPFETIPLTDSRFIIEAVHWDDRETGGKNHYHDWCEGVTTGHSHEHNEADLGFTVIGQPIPTRMYTNFLHQLSEDRPHDRLFLAEWSGGVNGHPPEHPAANVDYSFARMSREMAAGVYPMDWTRHVLAVIHPQVPNFDGRAHLNTLRQGIEPSEEEIEKGARSWYLPPSAMTLFHGDDFETGLRPYLESHGLGGRIYTVENGGDTEILASGENAYGVRLGATFKEISARQLYKEEPRLLFITATPGTGKSTALPVIEEFLQNHGYTVTTLGDKKALMDQIAQEVQDLPVNELGQKEGPHSILLNPEAPWYDWGIAFKDGHALNEAHRTLLRDVIQESYEHEGDDKHVILVEWATGQNLQYYDNHGWDLEELTQSPAQFVAWLDEFRLDHAVVLDLHASLETRVARNNDRKNEKGYIPETEFRKYFGDASFTPEDVTALGNRYVQIVNEGVTKNEFLSQITSVCETFFLPHLQGVERPASTMDPSRR